MKGSIKYAHSNGTKGSMNGIGIRDIAELLLNPDYVRIRLYNDADTDYERQADGTWTRTSGECGKRKTVKVESVEITEPGARWPKYRVRVVKASA